jgi:biopolymer transport protein ExbB
MQFAYLSGRWRMALCCLMTMLMIGSTVATIMSVTAPTVQAQDAETEEGAKEPESFFVFFYKAMGPLYLISFGLLSFFFVAMIVMCFMQIRREALMPSLLVQGFEAQLNEKKYQEAYEMVKADPSFLGKILSAGMGKLSAGYGEAQSAMQDAGDYENMGLEHKISYIALVGSVAPMLGLLGTVDGMVVAFAKIAASDKPPPPPVLAEGVMTALITTLVGLVMAIPAVMIYAFLKNRLQLLGTEVGNTVGSLMGRFATMGKK